MKSLFSAAILSFVLSTVASAAPQPPFNEECPVCHKNGRLIFSSTKDGKRIIFATSDCKSKFDKNPGKFTVKPAQK